MAKKKVAPKQGKKQMRKTAERAIKKAIDNLHDAGATISTSTVGAEPEKVLAEIQSQSEFCDKLARELAMADERRKEAKGDYDSAVERLRTLCRKPDMPLYEQNNDAPDKADPKD